MVDGVRGSGRNESDQLILGESDAQHPLEDSKQSKESDQVDLAYHSASQVSRNELVLIGSGAYLQTHTLKLPRPVLAEFNPYALRPANELLRRTQLILEHFGVEPETVMPVRLDDLAGGITLKQLKERLKHLDPQGELLKHYAEIVDDPQGIPVLRVYRDRDSKQRLDFEVKLAVPPPAAVDDPHASDTSIFSTNDVVGPLIQRASDDAAKPLQGMRIAIDPGHMGGEWADITGKYIENNGHRLSEGELAGKTAELLAATLRQLGAEVLITRTGANPVTSVAYDDIDIQAHGREALRAATGTSWFQELLTTPGDDAALIRAFERNFHVKDMFASHKRRHYFTSSDLDARAKKIRDFGADITLSLHFDAVVPLPLSPVTDHAINTSAPSRTKIYVPGGFMKGELSTREDRAYFARHLLEKDSWQESVDLGTSIVHSISNELGIPLQTGHGSNASKIENGVFARNLGLLRKVPDTAFVFVEALFYNRPDEFAALSRADNARIKQLAAAIANGIVANTQKGRAAGMSPSAR